VVESRPDDRHCDRRKTAVIREAIAGKPGTAQPLHRSNNKKSE